MILRQIRRIQHYSVLKPLRCMSGWGVVPNIKEECPSTESGDKVLFEGSQMITVRAMLGCTAFNFLYFSYYLTTCFWYHDIVIEGIRLGGDVGWGYAGAFGTGLIAFATRTYATRCACMVYETADGERLGFQVHTLLGTPGKKYEAMPKNITLGPPSKTGSSLIALQLKGLDHNILVDKSGTFFWGGKLTTMTELHYVKGREQQATPDSKDDRLKALKDTAPKRRRDHKVDIAGK